MQTHKSNAGERKKITKQRDDSRCTKDLKEQENR